MTKTCLNCIFGITCNLETGMALMCVHTKDWIGCPYTYNCDLWQDEDEFSNEYEDLTDYEKGV